MDYVLTSAGYFADYVDSIRQASPLHAENVDPVDRASTDTRFYISDDANSGFAVSSDGELKHVFSLLPGRGDEIVSTAVAAGAEHLNCFDGHLTRLYARHGFIVSERTPNWNADGPDVVVMQHVNRYN